MTKQVSLPWRITDDSGTPISGALLDTYEAGTDTPLTTYSDEALTTPLANPVVCDSQGRPPQMFYNGAVAIRVRVKDADSVVLDDFDPCLVGSTASAATDISFTPAGTIGSTNVQAAITEVVSDRDALKTGADTGLVSGTAGALNRLGKWNADGDLVDAGFSAPAVFTVGGVAYASATDTLSELAIGTAGQVLKVNTGATAPEWGAVVATYEQAWSAITYGGALTAVSHGLGSRPSKVWWEIRNTTTEAGYAVGEVIQMPNAGGYIGASSGWALSVISDTQIQLSIGTTGIRFMHKTSGNEVNLTAGNWEHRIVAQLF